MKKTWLRKAAAIALSAAMVMSSTPVSALAADDEVAPDPETAIEQVAEGDEDKEGEEAAPMLLLAAPAPEGGEDEGDDSEPEPTPAPAAETGIVYLDGVNGDDANDGTTAATAVKTFAKAKELLGADGTEIRMVNTVTVTSNETWTLGEGQIVIRDESFTVGPMVHVDAGVQFILQDITLDGGGKKIAADATYGSGSIVDMGKSGTQSTSTLVLLGATLKNNSSATDGGAIHAEGFASDDVWARKIFLQSSGNGTSAILNCSSDAGGGAINADTNVSISISEDTLIENCSATAGGAIKLWAGCSLLLKQSTISSCSASNGGGINSESSRVDVRENAAISSCSADASGGGLALYDSQMFLRTGSTISGCTSGTTGGGIVTSLSVVYVYGGSIDGNVAGTQGGGICLYNGSKAVLDGEVDAPVMITNNVSHVLNPDENGGPAMGGGGIYVDTTPVDQYGSPSYDPDKIAGWRVSEVLLAPTLITNNHAATDGGGLSFCPEGEGNIPADRSIAVFGNSTDKGNAEDLVVVRKNTTTSEGYTWSLNNRKDETGEDVRIYIPTTMLGGGACHWLDPDGNEYPLDQLQYNMCDFFGTSSVTEGSPEAQAAAELATVIISGNSSDCFGGGIACNGRILLSPYGKVNGDTVSLTINKTWSGDSEDLRPESLRFNVLQDGVKISYVDVTPNEDGDWSITVPDLLKSTPDGTRDYVYTIEEEAFEAPGEYEAGRPVVTTDGDGNVTAEVTNTLITPATVKLSKQNAGHEEISGATMQLLDADGNVVDEWTSGDEPHEVELKSGIYTMHEEAAPSGYAVATDIEFSVDARTGTVVVAGSTTAADDNLIVMVDDATTDVLFSKRDAGGDELAGARMQLVDSDGNVIDEWTSDGRNHKVALTSGTYTLHEEAAPSGYLVATDIEFTVDSEAGTVTVTGSTTAANKGLIVMVDDAKTVVAKFSKQAVDGNELKGAKMQLVDSDGNVVDEWTSDGANREIALTSGTYTLKELAAPDGYEVATDIEFTVDSEAGTVTVTGTTVAAADNLIVMVDNATPAPEGPKPEGPKPSTTTTVTTTVTTVTKAPATPNTGDHASAAGFLAIAGAAAIALSLGRRRLDA